MIRFLTNLFIAILLATSSVVSASAIEAASNCCCSEAITLHQLPERALQNNCLCCAPLPAHKLPNKTIQIEIKPIGFDLQPSSLFVLSAAKLSRIKITIDRRRPLHLASNELYLRKRALLL